MPITDLTGYTWVGNSTFPLIESLFYYSINFTSNNTNFYSFKTVETGQDEYSLYYDTTQAKYTYGGWVNEAYRTIVITGGPSATSANLIAWLQNNGTLTAPQPAVTDLTGTKWQINSTTSTSGYGKFAFDAIKLNNVNWGVYQFEYFCVGFQVSSSSVLYEEPEPSPFPEPQALANNVYLYDSYPTYQQISVGDTIEFGTFLSGYNANNISVSEANLISWLQSNATQIQTGYTITINGTGYSVNVGDSLLVNSTGLYNSTTSTQVWTYSGTGKFLGFNTSSGQSTPSSNYEINDTFTASSDLTLYSVEKLPTVTYDLANLNLSPGTYTITVKAKGEGYSDSVASNSVTYTVAPSGYDVEVTIEYSAGGGTNHIINIYDGQDNTGTLLYTYNDDESAHDIHETVNINNGSLYVEYIAAEGEITRFDSTGDVTSTNPAVVTGNGTWYARIK